MIAKKTTLSVHKPYETLFNINYQYTALIFEYKITRENKWKQNDQRII